MLRFDYFSFLWDVHDEKFREYGHNRLEHDSQLALIVPEIFKVALGSAKAAEEYKLKSVGESWMMRRTSEVVDEFIGREGSAECEKLAKMRAVSLPTTASNKMNYSRKKSKLGECVGIN